MFSSEVILAVEVLLSLDQRRGERGGEEYVCEKDLSFIPISGLMRKSILNKVLRKLLAAQYISVKLGCPRKYSLQKNPEEITLLHLVKLFHGDICIGEGYDHYIVRGHENIPTQSYVLFWLHEKKLYQKLHDQFETTPITHFRDRTDSDRISPSVDQHTEEQRMVGNSDF